MMESSSFQPSVRRTTMKMASVSVVSVFLLCCSAVASQGCDKFVAVGGSVNVPLGYDVKSATSLRWNFEGNIIFHKRPDKVVLGEVGDINADGSLKLTNLKKDQAGLYTPEVYKKDGKSETLKSTKLCVLDPVKKPNLTEICQDQKVKFECNLGQQPPDAVLEWLQNKKPVPNEKKKVPGTKVVLEKKIADLKEDIFVCKVSNNAGSEESNAVVHSCGRTSIPGLPDELWGINIWVYVGGGGGIVILLIIIVIFCCVRTKRTRKLRLKDEEELRLEWTNTNHHPNHPPLPDHPPPHHPNRHHHHHHHHQHQQQQQEQQQAPGNTGPRQSRSKQSRQPRARAPEPNGQPQPSPRRTGQTQKPASDADDEQPPPLPQPRKKGPKTQLD